MPVLIRNLGYALLTLALTVGPVRAHHVWIIPMARGNAAIVVWSDTPTADNVDEKLNTIADARVFLRRATGQVEDLKWTEDKDVYRLDCPGEDIRTLGATWEGNGCRYFARADLPNKAGKFDAAGKHKPWDRLELEILPCRDRGADAYQVLFRGQPAAGVLVVTHSAEPSSGLPRPRTDKEGFFTFKPPRAGIYGFRVQHRTKEPGERLERHHASTLVILAPVVEK